MFKITWTHPMQSIWMDGIVSIVLFTFHPIRQICSINLIFIIEKHQQLFVTTNMRLTVTFLVAIFPFEGHLFFINSFRCDAPHCMPTITYFTFGRTDFFSHENILLLYAFSESMNNIKCNDRFKVCTFRMWNMRAFQYHACFNTFKMKNQQQTGCVEWVYRNFERFSWIIYAGVDQAEYWNWCLILCRTLYSCSPVNSDFKTWTC